MIPPLLKCDATLHCEIYGPVRLTVVTVYIP